MKAPLMFGIFSTFQYYTATIAFLKSIKLIEST